MRTIDVSLPDEVQAFVEAEAEQAGFDTASQYVEAVLKELWRGHSQSDIEPQLTEGFASGDAVEVTPEYWRSLKDRLRERSAKSVQP